MLKHKHISNFSVNISKHSEILTSMEKNMIQELLKNQDEFNYYNFTIANVAENLNVSSTSLHRLSKKLGYPSFTLMKEDFFKKSDLSEENENPYNYITMINNTYQLVEQSISDNVIECMLNAKKITIYGMGMSSYIGKMFQIKLQLLGIPAEHYDDSRFMKLSSSVLDPKKDVIIILSRSGCPPELIEVMVKAQKNKIQSILITEAKQSPLETMASYVIQTAYAIDNDDDVDTRINAHIAMDLIIKKFIEKKKEELHEGNV